MPIQRLAADHLAARPGGYEPQRRNHYQLTLGLDQIGLGADADELVTLSVVRAFLPNEGNEEIAIPWKNETQYVAGRRTLESGTVAVRDFVDKRTAEYIYKWRQKVYDPMTGAVGYAVDYKVNADLIITGPDGKKKKEFGDRVYKLIGCWPQAVNPGELNDESNEIVVLELTLRFDKAVAEFALGDFFAGS